MNANAIYAPAVAACDDAMFTCRVVALATPNAARAQVNRSARSTDAPGRRDVNAASCLDIAAKLFAWSTSL